MSWVEWHRPSRDDEFKNLSSLVWRTRQMRLRSAYSYHEALAHGGDYWLADGALQQQFFEADSLDEIRAWLRLPARLTTV